MQGKATTEVTENGEKIQLKRKKGRGLTRIVEWIMEMGGCLPGEGAIYSMKAV